MGKVLKCPECGKLIATIFPLHNCVPSKKETEMTKRYWHQKSSHTDKINWLLDHQELWIGWNDIGDPRHKEIFNAMVKDGLLSEKSYWKDLSLTKLIYEARKIRRESHFHTGSEFQIDDSPIPSSHKSIDDYQSQLKAKKKRRKR